MDEAGASTMAHYHGYTSWQGRATRDSDEVRLAYVRQMVSLPREWEWGVGAPERLKRALRLAGTDECSNCDVGCGPVGRCMMEPASTHGLMSIAAWNKTKQKHASARQS